MSLLSLLLLRNKDSANKAKELLHAMYLMGTQEKSAFSLWQCRRDHAAEETANTTISDLLSTGEGISARLLPPAPPPPLTEAAIFESTKFSKVPRTAVVISCQCYPPYPMALCKLLSLPPKFILSSLFDSQEKICSFQRRRNKKLLFHNPSSWGQQYSGCCQGTYIYFFISDETASESTASSPDWHYPVYHR